MCSTLENKSNQSEDELDDKLTQEEYKLLWPDFVSRISNPTVNSVQLHWSLLKNASVYCIDKFHKKLGWLQLDWTSSSPITVTNLEENFGYRLRIKALTVSKDGHCYVPLAISPEIVVNIINIIKSIYQKRSASKHETMHNQTYIYTYFLQISGSAGSKYSFNLYFDSSLNGFFFRFYSLKSMFKAVRSVSTDHIKCIHIFWIRLNSLVASVMSVRPHERRELYITCIYKRS